MEKIIVENQIMVDELHQFVIPMDGHQVEAPLPGCRVP
jgi:hypothetical protein